jgi:hypothetical protein
MIKSIAPYILMAVISICITVMFVQVTNQQNIKVRLEHCDKIANEVTRTSCINGWEGP